MTACTMSTGPSNVSAWMSNAVSERQCAQTCMHITCFKGLEASNVSAWMSNAVSGNVLRRACTSCFNAGAQNTADVHDWSAA